MNLSRVTTIVLACTMQYCFALAEPIRVEEDKKNEVNHISHNSSLSLPVVNSKLRGDSESNSISNAGHGTPNRVLNGEKLTITPGMYNIKSMYGNSIWIPKLYMSDDVHLIQGTNNHGIYVFIRSMGGNKYAIHSHQEESYMCVSGKGSNRKITRQPHAHSYEMFYIISRGEKNVVSFQSAKWGSYLKATSSDGKKGVYTSTNLGSKEKFTLAFYPSDIYTKYPEYTYRIESKFGTNIRISKTSNDVRMTTSDGSMERIVLRPLCTPECDGLYALKSAEFGERYVSMPKTFGDRVKMQTRVGSWEVFEIYERYSSQKKIYSSDQIFSLDDDGPGPGEFMYVTFRSHKFQTYMKAKPDMDLYPPFLEPATKTKSQEKFRLYRE